MGGDGHSRHLILRPRALRSSRGQETLASARIKARQHSPAKSLGKYIESDPTVCGGEPVIKGTRVRVRDILELFTDGYRIEEISRSFPRVSPEAAVEAVHFAGEVLNKTYQTRRR